MNKKILFIFMIFFSFSLYSQGDYLNLMSSGDYKSALQIILPQLEKIYSERSDNKRVPNTFLTLGMAEEGIDLNRLFRERKTFPWFVEDNPALNSLYRDAGICFLNTKEYDNALRHLFESLRYKKIEYVTDAPLFYSISRAYLFSGYSTAYLCTLESAISLDSSNADYCLELGRALYRSRDKKRAINYLEKYLSVKGSTDDLSVLLMLAGLHIDVGNYLKAADYYRMHIGRKDDPYVRYALGTLCYERIGNHGEAVANLDAALASLPQSEILMRQKCLEYKGDILYRDLKFEAALASYGATAEYENKVNAVLESKTGELKALNQSIRDLKSFLVKKQDYVKFNEYQLQNLDREKLEYELMQQRYEIRKLNSGKVRWNSAECLERLERYLEAIDFYRKAIDFNYKPNIARERIIKLQLKIKRGY